MNSKKSKVRLYGTRLAPLEDIFSNLNQKYIKHKPKLKLNLNKHKSINNKLKKENELFNNNNNNKEQLHRPISFIEQRDILIDELILFLKNNSMELYDLCESLVLSSSEYTSLAFVVSEKPEVQLTKETFATVLSKLLQNYDIEHARQLFEAIDVERNGYINIHQLVALVDFARLHRGATIDEILRAIFEGVIWEVALFEQNRPVSQRRQNGRNITPYITLNHSQFTISFDLYKKHLKRKEILDSHLRLLLPFPSIISALRTVCPKGGHRLRHNLNSSHENHPILNSSLNDDTDSIDSFLYQLYECIINDLSSKHRSPFRSTRTEPSNKPSIQFPIINLTEPMNQINDILFDTNQEAQSFNYHDMINNKHYLTMKLSLDDILVFASTLPEIQSKLRAELIDHFVRQEGEGTCMIQRRHRQLT